MNPESIVTPSVISFPVAIAPPRDTTDLHEPAARAGAAHAQRPTAVQHAGQHVGAAAETVVAARGDQFEGVGSAKSELDLANLGQKSI